MTLKHHLVQLQVLRAKTQGVAQKHQGKTAVVVAKELARNQVRAGFEGGHTSLCAT